MPTLPNVLCASIGVEMEFNFNAARSKVRIESLGHRWADVAYASPPHHVRKKGFLKAKAVRDWVAKEEHTGIEFAQRLPSFRGPALERKIEGLCAGVRESNGAIGGTFDCGVHVHIRVPESLQQNHYLAPDYARFLLGHERFFMYCVPRTRQFGYNPPHLQSTRYLLRGQAAPQSTENLIGRISAPSALRTRYWAHALSEFGTIEFRLLEGTEDPQRVINWIALIEFIHKQAIEGHLPSALLYADTDNKHLVLEKMHAFFNFPQHIHDWLVAQYTNALH